MAFQKICVLHLNQIGDLLFSLPLLRALRENNPASMIHSIIRPHLKDLLIHSPDADRLLYRERGIKNRLGLLKEIRRNRYDLFITLSRSEECLLLAAFSRAKVKAGFQKKPWDFGLHIKETMEGPSSWHNNFRLLKRLNMEAKKKDYVGMIALPPRFDPPEDRGRYVVLSAGTSSRRRIKEWEEEKFGDVILLLREKLGLHAVLVGGEESKTVNEKIVQRIVSREGGQKTNLVEDLAGKTDLLELCHLLKQASLFVGVDSGIMHLASSFDIPVVGIFGPTDPFYVGPQNKKSLVVREEMECSPCHLKGCEERTCMRRLDVKKVMEACDHLIRHEGVRKQQGQNRNRVA
jgi:ADP-heptose:LPS heptosyltransferase